MKVTGLQFSAGLPARESRLTRIITAMLDAAEAHPECDADAMSLLISGFDTGIHDADALGVTYSVGIAPGDRARVLLALLTAELKGTGRTVQIIDGRPQG